MARAADSNVPEVKVKSLKKALDVLSCFTRKQPLGVSEISEMLGIYKSNAYDILSTFTAEHYLEKDAQSGKYYLGSEIITLSRALGNRYSFLSVASGLINAIAEETNECVYLTTPMEREIYYLDAAYPAKANIHYMALRSSSDPMHTTSSGKCMLAFMSEPELDDYLSYPLEKMTENTITEPDALKKELAKVRAQGFAYDDEENTLGIRCVGVPLVSGANSRLLGAISISGRLENFSPERMTELASVLKREVQSVSRFL